MTIRRGRVNLNRGPAGITQLTDDVVAGPGTGSVPATIPANTVTFAQLQDINQGTIIGRGALYGAGDPEEIAIGPGLKMVDRTLQASPFAGAVFTFDEQLKAFVTPR